MKLGINTILYCAPTSIIELPINTWNEIKDWYIKWDTLHYTTDNENWNKIALNNDSTDAIDWKRPIKTEIFDPETNELIEEADE